MVSQLEEALLSFLCLFQWLSECGPAASAAPGYSLEMQVLRPYPRSPGSETLRVRPARCLFYKPITPKFGDHWLILFEKAFL